MLGSFVCNQCRKRLVRRIHSVRAPQWQPRATIVSFRNSNPHTRPANTPSDAQHHEDSVPEEAREQPSIHLHKQHELSPSQPPRGSGRYSRLVGDPEPSTASNVTIRHVPHQYGVAHNLVKLMARSGHADDAWHYFEQTYTSRDCDALSNPTEGDVSKLRSGEVFDELLRKVTASFCYAADKPTTTPTMVLFKYEQLGLTTEGHWKWRTLEYLTHQALVAVNAPPEGSKGHLPSILVELLSVWRLFFQCKGQGAQLDSIRADWNLPAPENIPFVHDSKNFTTRLQDYLPGHRVDSLLAYCAVYLYTISDAFAANESLLKEAEPFIKFLTQLLAGSHVSAVIAYTQWGGRTKFRGLPETVQQEIVRELDNAPLKALKAIGRNTNSKALPKVVQTENVRALDEAPSKAPKALGGLNVTTEPEPEGIATANLEAYHLSRIERAVESERSATRLETLWKEAIQAYTAEGKVAVPRRVYNAFLSGYAILNRAPRTVEVWNHMIANGINPDIQSWVALLHGCERAWDLNGFNTIWSRMLNSGIELDAHAWTTRVHGLFHLREINLGLAALDEMGKRWLTAEKNNEQPPSNSGSRQSYKKRPVSGNAINKHIKPSIEVINGAITALVQSTDKKLRHEKRVEHIQKLLAWAGGFNINPDAVTYNALIRLYIRASDRSTAFKVLRQMEREGIEADMATHTMLINSSFDNGAFDGLSHAQQTEKIISMLDGLQAGGLKLNDYVYSTAIDRLLKNYSNYTAVRQLVEHMQAHKLVPSKHAYTSLITHYFKQDPPAIAAVDSLVNQIFTSHRVIADRFLLDRTLEGYAFHDEIGKMMGLLTRMSRRGIQSGWHALTAVIQALVRDGDYDGARSIVREVEIGDQANRWGITGGSAQQERFFYQARQLGVAHQDDSKGDDMREFGSGSSSGDFTMSDSASKASGDEKVLEEQVRKQEEDVHGFLQDEHHDMHSQVNKQ
ncbi:hypothetical protein BDU57DRAFT_519705 [Ampelomyces quisqualis]|uniref:Pentacotripeptide-repeat region of PRORP domain-containing protein n=1 Tax=Ampelomyces quisqualis TaxID=50730 RepID=A0A6A5QGD3_AMPQU|nr:hypothetical protein BDU57DRAFT_519705 [Ampelomyces quisqualis]